MRKKKAFDIVFDQMYKIGDELSENTLRVYKKAWNEFGEYLDEREIDNFSELTSSQINTFLKKSTKSKSSRNQHLAAIRYMLESVNELKDVNVDNISSIRKRVKFIKPSKPDKLTISYDEILEGIDELNVLYSGKRVIERNMLIMRLMVATMARCSEIAGIQIRDFKTDTGVLEIRGKGGLGIGDGMRDVTDSIKIDDQELLDDIDRFILHWRYKCENEPLRILAGQGYSTPLFSSQKGKRLTSRSIYSIANKVVSSVVDTSRHANHGPHCIRRSIALYLLRGDKKRGREPKNIVEISHLLRHERLETTMLYLDIDYDKESFF